MISTVRMSRAVTAQLELQKEKIQALRSQIRILLRINREKTARIRKLREDLGLARVRDRALERELKQFRKKQMRLPI